VKIQKIPAPSIRPSSIPDSRHPPAPLPCSQTLDLSARARVHGCCCCCSIRSDAPTWLLPSPASPLQEASPSVPAVTAAAAPDLSPGNSPSPNPSLISISRTRRLCGSLSFSSLGLAPFVSSNFERNSRLWGGFPRRWGLFGELSLRSPRFRLKNRRSFEISAAFFCPYSSFPFYLGS
jgi:hypothetical protein